MRYFIIMTSYEDEIECNQKVSRVFAKGNLNMMRSVSFTIYQLPLRKYINQSAYQSSDG
jgi:hypothetical protein